MRAYSAINKVRPDMDKHDGAQESMFILGGVELFTLTAGGA